MDDNPIYIIIYILVDFAPVSILAKIAQLDRQCRDIVGNKLAKMGHLYKKYSPKFARAIYRKYIGHPVTGYYRYISTKQYFSNMGGNVHMGISLIDHEFPPFEDKFFEDNVLSICNITLWLTKPVDFLAVLYVDGAPLIVRGYNKSNCEKAYQLSDGTYCNVIQLRFPGELNPIPINDQLPLARAPYLCLWPRGTRIQIDNPIFDVSFAALHIRAVVVTYLVAPRIRAGVNICADTGLYFSGDFRSQWIRRSFLRHNSDIAEIDGELVDLHGGKTLEKIIPSLKMQQ